VAKRKTAAPSVGPTNGQVHHRIRLVIADGDAIDRAGLVALMEREPDLQVLDATSTVDETISACGRSRPDVLLLTLTLPGGSGDGALPRILDRHPDLRIVALSEHSRDHCLVLNPPVPALGNSAAAGPRLGHGPHLCSRGTTCLRVAAEHGARATVRRNSEFATLLEAVRRVHAGEVCHAEDALDDSHPPGAFQPLSERERMVAAHIARGLSNKEIASALDISEATVKKHVGRVLAKLGLQDRLQVGLFLARNPLILTPRRDNGPRRPATD
jgi:DNA-binding NarL/FixJ family response regulator